MTEADRDVAFSDLRRGDVVLVRGDMTRVFDDTTFREGKAARPAIIVWTEDEMLVAAPIYKTGDGHPQNPWMGRPRIGITKNKSNGLDRIMSQVGVDNSFLLGRENFIDKIGAESDSYMEILSNEFRSIASERVSKGLFPGIG